MVSFPSVRDQLDLTGQYIAITGGAGFLGQNFAQGVAEMGAIPLLLDVDENTLNSTLQDFLQIPFLTDRMIYIRCIRPVDPHATATPRRSKFAFSYEG